MCADITNCLTRFTWGAGAKVFNPSKYDGNRPIILITTVDIGDGHTDQIILREGDNPQVSLIPETIPLFAETLMPAMTAQTGTWFALSAPPFDLYVCCVELAAWICIVQLVLNS